MTNTEHPVESEAPCAACGIGNPTCFLEGGYCCIACQETGGMVHQPYVTPPKRSER